MKTSFAVACLIAGSSAVKLRQTRTGPWVWDSSKTPWDKDSLPACPADDGRTIMDDGETHVSKYPNVGATCAFAQTKDDMNLVQFVDNTSQYDPVQNLAQSKDPNWGPSVDSLPHCPDFDERFTLNDGKTKAIPYPQVYYNCKSDYQLPQKKQTLAQDPNWGPSVNSLENCPDFDERFTLKDGVTRAVPYPEVYFNCRADYQLIQRLNLQQKSEPNWGPSVNGLEKCPDFDERFTLKDGTTKAIPYPQVYFNCNADYQLHQKQDPNWGPSVDSLPHCPDFDERMTLTDGQTKAIPYPQVYYNCKADYQLSKGAKKAETKETTTDMKLKI